MSNDHFAIIDDAISPQPWMQQRLVATAEKDSVSRDYDVSGGTNKNELIHTVEVKWTNNTPIAQWVYGLVTREGAVVDLQARSRAYLATYQALEITATPTPPGSFAYIETSRFGCGLDVGRGGLLGIGSGFAIQGAHQNSNTTPLMPHLGYWQRVEAGKTIHARVAVKFVSQFWENTSIDGGDSSTHSGFISGGTRVDLWAIPVIVDPGPRLIPQVIGASSGNTFSGDVNVAKVTGVAAGDVIIAFAMNQFGLDSDIQPKQAGWTLLHQPARTVGLDGWEDVHLKAFMRVATGSEPATYGFTNGFLADEIVVMIVLRNVSTSIDDGWYVASTVRKYWWERDDGHICPSLDRAGSILLCLSYIAHAGGQTPMLQTQPEGMTEIIEHAAGLCTVSVASLLSPPRPTQERTFVPNKVPFWSGHNIALTMLLPGKQP